MTVKQSLPLHVNSINGEIAELCYIDISEKRYIVTHIMSTHIVLKRVGFKQVLLVINTLLGDTFTFIHLFTDSTIPLKNVDLSINRQVTYDEIVDSIHEYYHQVVY
jgi:hypothetical protein